MVDQTEDNVVHDEKRRADKMKANEQKPLRRLLQFDGYTADVENDILVRDQYGLGVSFSSTYEFQRVDYPVRVYISPNATATTALALLDRIRISIATYGLTIRPAKPHASLRRLLATTLAALDEPEAPFPDEQWPL